MTTRRDSALEADEAVETCKDVGSICLHACFIVRTLGEPSIGIKSLYHAPNTN